MNLFKKAARHLPALLGIVLLVGAVYVVWKEFRHLRIADISAALSAIPVHALGISFVWTILSYGILTFYDRLGTMYAGHKTSYGKVAFASFCAYSLSHNLGFAAVSGAAVRYRLYAHWGLTPFQIAKVVAFCSLTFGLGGMVLGGIILFTEPDAVPFFGEVMPRWAMYAIGAGLWAIVAAYVALAKVVGTIRLFGHSAELPGFRMAVVQVLLATVDVAVTAAIFYALLPAMPHKPGVPDLTFVRFLAVYVASYTAGLAANLPGGIGVFDTAMLLGLGPYLAPPQILGAIVVFRLYYYIIPLFLAGGLFAGNELVLRGGSLLKGRALGRAAEAVSRWTDPSFAVATSTGAVTLCGIMLLSLGVLDQRPDFSWIDPDFAETAANAGQFVPSLIGAGLIVLAIGLAQRVTLAWGATMALLLIAAAFTAAQGTTFWVPAVLVVVALLLTPIRSAFYRHARLINGPLQTGTALPLIGLLGCTIALALFEPHLRGLSENSWWEVVLSREVPNGLRITVALAVVLAMLALWRLVRPGRVGWVPWAGEGRLRYAALGAVPPPEADGLVMGEKNRAGIPFRRMGRVIVGLGDPAGSASDQASAIWRLRDLAVQEGLDPAVWLAGPDLLHIYGDLGLAALPLGRDGLPLPETQGEVPTVRHYLCCVAERDLKDLLPMLPTLGTVRHTQVAV